MLCASLTQDLARIHVQAREERRGPMASVVMRAPFGLAGPKWQQRGGAIERLNLRLLVDAEDERMLRRRHIEPEDVAYFVDQLRVGRQLERFGLAINELEASLTHVFDRPGPGGHFFETVIRENLDLGRPDRVALLFPRRITSLRRRTLASFGKKKPIEDV